MKFGMFYEHQLPEPWTEGSELKLYQDALDQVELADKLGYDYVWEVEHHFLEEYSHSSAPEVFLAACSQRTKNIRLGHGVMLMSPNYNHPARSAERIATLDLVSRGRVEWGTGESATAMEMGGFGMTPDDKTQKWQEATEQAANMMAMTPYPGYKGEYFEMPARNVVPKPVQRPHPPMWVACSRRESIHRAAKHGLGALAFAFVEPEQAAHWVQEYYDIIKSDECVPLAHTVNPNIALVSGMSIHEDEQEALDRGLDGFRFFGYSLGYYGLYGQHRPGRSQVWEKFLEVKDGLKDNAGNGGIGTPDQVRAHLERYEKIGVDQIIFVQQSGNNKHEHIMESLQLFADTVMPDFKARDLIREAKKREELAPYIEAALARKKRMAEIEEMDIPVVDAFGRKKDATVGVAQVSTFSDRGGSISVPRADPHAKKEKVES
ncbi:alkanesulfonate monooxygenase SsuD/methylene tetrahydromethanopterin reductase-like flavin-dependent oxidoreductase (luciferase family) [Rhodoligotrophos appendicifer]|uniref:LLM class flavin-dependent oxidoreductase n=1 Tax=Rhodoligotrophos appendicifer TaxID=987056 RepID=UPI0011871972|nr:LLM class flavin-dependent oxidoreductase [Rhodoligotrophos appendicifer]